MSLNLASGKSNQKQTTLSIVVPVYNEEDSIQVFLGVLRPVLEELLNVLGHSGRVELIFIDDGSQDETANVIMATDVPNIDIRLIKLSRNFGKDSALAAGLAHARGDAVVPIDVDLQDPPEILPNMARAWLAGAKVVNAVRSDRSTDSRLKRITAKSFYRIYNILADKPIEPNVGDFRLLDRQVVDTLNKFPERIRFMKGLFSWVGYMPTQVEYSRAQRAEGQSKWRPWSLWTFALDGITGSTTLPLRIWTYLGSALALMALTFAVFIIFRTAIYGIDAPGYASLMVVTLTLGAANLIAIGILGEYVGRIAIEVRQRPLYIVESIKDIYPKEKIKQTKNVSSV